MNHLRHLLVLTALLFGCHLPMAQALASGTIVLDLEYYEWNRAFDALTPGMPRLEAEQIIAKARKKASTYDLYQDMDVDDVVVYALGRGFILIVWYRPGTPPGGSPQGVILPRDAMYVRHVISTIR